MRAPYLAPVANIEDGVGGSDPFSPRDVMLAVRRRWWAVPVVFALFCLHHLNEPLFA